MRHFLIMPCYLIACSACAIVDKVAGNSPAAIASENATRIQKLRLGMSESEVAATMGKHSGGLGNDIANPYRVERAVSGGEAIAVLFYVTTCPPDKHITDENLTPVVLINDKMIGYGRAALQAAGQRATSGRE